jgi:AraC-like DNA-binding protein
MHSSMATASSRAMLATAESRGVDTADLLLRLGIERALVDDPDGRIFAPTAMALWDALRERCRDPALQLAAPEALPFGAYRVLDYLVYASPTVGDGIIRFGRFFRLIADAVRLSVQAEDDERRLEIQLVDGGAVPGVYVDFVFAALVRGIRLKIDPHFPVRRLELRHPPPPDPSPYFACFRAPVAFHLPVDRLCFGVEEWGTPIPQADTALAAILEEHARMLLPGAPEPADEFVAAVRGAMASGLPEDMGAETVARAVHVSVRTMQRRLVAVGTTFRDVADAVRKDLAEAYLADPRVSIAETAFLLGFADQASFTRSFQRWTGAAPGAWRKRQTCNLTTSQIRRRGQTDYRNLQPPPRREVVAG